ncbi:hypothetical protein D3C81_237390 [compost metagenome]
MLIQGALWGLLVGVVLIVCMSLSMLAKLCEGDWGLFREVLGDMVKDRTTSLWRTLGAILLAFVVMGTGVAGLYQGGLSAIVVKFGLAFYCLAYAVFYIGVAVMNTGWKGWRHWSAVWRTMHRYGTPQRKWRNKIITRIFFAAMALSAFYGWLGLYDSLL